MKKIILYLVCISTVVCWQCTDFINVRPENSATYTNYFKTQKDAEALLRDLELKIKRVAGTSWRERTGLIEDTDHSYVRDQLTPYDCYFSWNQFYAVIYQADLILDNAHRFELSETEMKPYILQAYFAKAVAYFYLAMNFGEVPITKGSTTFDKYPQSSVTQVLDEAEKWALKAMELPTYEKMVQESSAKRMKQYASKGAAAALIAHLYAWRAGVEGKSEYREKAEEYCSKIINGETGFYKLAVNAEEICTDVMHRDSDESIWEIYYNSQETGHIRKGMPFVGFPIITTADYLPNPEYDYQVAIYKTTVDRMYPKGDGRRDAYFWATDADSVYVKRVDGKVVAATERTPGEVIMAYHNQSIKRAYLYKFRYPYYTFSDGYSEPYYEGLDQNKVIWRLGEIYLLRAECRARQKKANAVEDLNKIRCRAYGNMDESGGVKDFELVKKYAFPCPDDVKNGLADNIQLAIFREREKELLQEFHRYFDIVRNGWCYLRGEDSYDYIRKEISSAYATLTDEDIKDGALYSMLAEDCFINNDLIRQNRYWNRRQQ